MGRLLGSFADREELDRPDLNKCPDCKCFFGGDNCPICGKPCPEEMRAGNRKPVKPPKRSRGGSGRVTFVDWYHSWWFMAIIMLIFPLAGIVLLVTSPHEKWKKLTAGAVAVVYFIFSTIGFGGIISGLTDIFDRPVDTSLSREEYVAACRTVNAEELYRSSDLYKDEFVTLTLKVVDRATSVNEDYDTDKVYYICEAEGGSDFKIVIRDCIIDTPQKFITGDVVTIYGECDGECSAYDSTYDPINGPLVNVAYASRKK